MQVRHQDLLEWRRHNDLNGHPAVIIASASRNFPMHKSLHEYAQKVYIGTGKNAGPDRIRYWRDLGYPILITGKDRMVQGASLIHALQGLGFKSIYLIAGPQMLDIMVRDKQLSRLYLTITHQLKGGMYFRTLLTGSTLGPEGNLKLNSMYYEPNSHPPGPASFSCNLA